MRLEIYGAGSFSSGFFTAIYAAPGSKVEASIPMCDETSLRNAIAGAMDGDVVD